jgi:hypothetical protein
LLVHVPVVLVPIAAILCAILAFRSAWLDRYGWFLVGLTGVAMIGAILAAGSGEALESLQNEAETTARENHFELGETARNLSIAFFLVVLAVMLLRYFASREGTRAEDLRKVVHSRLGTVAVSAVPLLTSVGATYTMVKAGHQGAKLAWWCDAHRDDPACR